MSRSIVSISYLVEYSDGNRLKYHRIRVAPILGKFKLTKKCKKRASGQVQRTLSAYDFITDDSVSAGDPVLALNDGNKLRVYQGGDKTYMLTEPRSLIELHDLKYTNPKKKVKSKNSKTYDQLDYEYLSYPWPTYP